MKLHWPEIFTNPDFRYDPKDPFARASAYSDAMMAWGLVMICKSMGEKIPEPVPNWFGTAMVIIGNVVGETVMPELSGDKKGARPINQRLPYPPTPKEDETLPSKEMDHGKLNREIMREIKWRKFVMAYRRFVNLDPVWKRWEKSIPSKELQLNF